MVAAMLRPRGFRVLTAVSGKEAKALAGANGQIDLLLTDLEMPEMRGDELAAWFRTVRPGMPILFMSSQNVVGAAEVHPFLPKPFRAETLIRTVRAVLNNHSARAAETAP